MSVIAALGPLQETTEEPVDVSDAFNPQQFLEGCADGGFLCEQVYDLTGSETAADWTAFFVGGPLVVILILVAAWIFNRLVRRAIDRLSERLQKASAEAQDSEADTPWGLQGADEVTLARAQQRTKALAGVLRSIAAVTIWSLAILLVLAQIGINLGPLIAGAGILGVALGFGAQSVVADFLTGFFMLLEDQFGIGDNVDLGEATGEVEKVTLRTTVVRDLSGTVWHVPNSKIERVGNRSQLWARALLDLGVAYNADIDEAEQVITDACHRLKLDPDWEDKILEEPRVMGVEDLAADQVTIRLMFKTQPAEQWNVQRELRRRIKDALDAAGIEIPFPQRTVWVRSDDGDTVAA